VRIAVSHAPSDRFSTALEFAAALEAPLPRDLMARTAPAAKRSRPANQAPPPVDAATVAARPRGGATGARGRRWVVPLAATCALAAIAIVAFAVTRRTTSATHAPIDAAAIDPLATARTAEREGKLEIAVAHYLEAFAETSDPELLFRIGELYERLDRGRDAIHYFESYLERAPRANDREAVLARIERLRPAPPVDAGVVAMVADAAPPTATRQAPSTPDPKCRCIHSLDGVNREWLCTKKYAPRCSCLSEREGLCPTPFELCPADGACPKEATARNGVRWSCSVGPPRTLWKEAVPGAACRGYAARELPKTGQPYEPRELDGAWDCNFCVGPSDLPLDAQRMRFATAGQPGDACSGYLLSTGEHSTGKVECKDTW
jgi:tetratricopeptide (TPR) repeat protein